MRNDDANAFDDENAGNWITDGMGDLNDIRNPPNKQGQDQNDHRNHNDFDDGEGFAMHCVSFQKRGLL
jgi:hypothetical protein